MNKKLTAKQAEKFNKDFIITGEIIETDFYQINKNGVFSYHSSDNDFSDKMNFLVTLKNRHTNKIIYQKRFDTDMIMGDLLIFWTNLYATSQSIDEFIKKIENQNQNK